MRTLCGMRQNGYDCYYFGDGDDGAMRTNKTSVAIDGDNYNFYFEKSGGNKGCWCDWREG